MQRCLRHRCHPVDSLCWFVIDYTTANAFVRKLQGGVLFMLVLTRKSNQSIMIGDDIEVSVLSIRGEKVRVGIQAPRNIPVFRKEVYLEIQQEKAGSSRAEVDKALENLRSEPEK
jgi:carbon storage regulator